MVKSSVLNKFRLAPSVAQRSAWVMIAGHDRVSQSKFKRVECGYTANADFNGALNVLAPWRQGITAYAL